MYLGNEGNFEVVSNPRDRVTSNGATRISITRYFPIPKLENRRNEIFFLALNLNKQGNEIFYTPKLETF